MIVDCDFTLNYVLSKRQELPAPNEVLMRQRIVRVSYYSFDKKLHSGQVVIDRGLVDDIKAAFEIARKSKFPIKSVIPYIDRSQMTKGERDESLNNSSAFNYRLITGTKTLSQHAFGRAIDINPKQNPFNGSTYDTNISGTISAECDLLIFFKSRKWTWGGDWVEKRDYMHFEKTLI